MAAHRDIEPAVLEETASNSLIQNTRCCFCFPCSRTPSVGIAFWERIRSSDSSLWARTVGAFRKVREWSEIVAGPRWKTFIRRFNRNKSGRNGQFQYDPLSYALNFDENDYLEQDIDYGGMRAFSTRYASVKETPPLNLN